MILTKNNINDNYIPSNKIEELIKTYDSLNLKQKEIVDKFFSQPENSEKYHDLLHSMMWIHPCPTPEEFIDPKFGYLPIEMIDSLYPFIKDNFIKSMNTQNPYTYIVNYGSTRCGKSLLNQLYIVYSIIYINYMRFPHLYYGLNPLSNISIYLVSFKKDKTKELILSPLTNILYASKFFKNVKYEDGVREKGVTPEGIIHFSEACSIVTTGGLTFPKLLILCGSRVGDVIGSNIVSGVISEINHFKEMAHISDEDVLNIFTKLDGRISGTILRNRFPCFLAIDSSSNCAESPIEKLVQVDLRNNKDCFYKYYRRWELLPEKFPKWANANKLEGENLNVFESKTWKKSWSTENRPLETFEVVVGDGSHPAFLIKEKKQKEGIPNNLIVKFPIDTYDELNRNLIESIKDIGGISSSNESKLVQDYRIIENIWDENLDNIEGEIIAGAKILPDKLIWNQIYKKFFLDRGNGQFQILRAPREPRFIGIDTAVAIQGCIMGVDVVHPEIGHDGEILAVNDFSLAIAPDATGINLDALNMFILDLMMLGHLSINVVAFDQFQSKQTQQNLERAGINCIQFSVDLSVEPYQYFVGILYNGLYKCGKNIYLKNNLDSLYRGTDLKGNEKVLKSKGTPVHKYNGNWELSTAGKYEKDVSDATCRAVYLMMHNKEVKPVTLYEEENRRIGLKNKALKLNNFAGGSNDQYLLKKLYGIK